MRCQINLVLIFLLAQILLRKSAKSEDDSEKAIRQKYIDVFGLPPDYKPDAEEEATTEFSLDPQTLTRVSANELASCVRSDGLPGVCVVYYLCDPETKRLITNGETLIDVRIGECPHSLDVCCLEEAVNTTTRDAVLPTKVIPTKCGYSNPGAQAFKIVNDGTTAEFGEYPWMVAILKNSSANKNWSPEDFVGSGSIIHPCVVLTVAHKVDGKLGEIKCRAGEWDTQIDEEIYPHQDRMVKKIVLHENYKRKTAQYNVALLFLERPFELSSATPHMGVACIAHKLPEPGTECETMGWGTKAFNVSVNSVIIKKVTLPLVNHERCQDALRETRLGPRFKLHQSFTCAGGVRGKDTCKGDGGSPLICPIGDAKELRFAIVGTVAWGIGCGEEGVPGVYVNIPSFRSWISEQMMLEGIVGDSYEYDD